MAKPRSPHYPSLPLREALAKARKVYESEHTHPADRKVIAEDLGYSGLSGPSASLIGTLRQYGILQNAGEGMRISDDAVTVFELAEGNVEREEAMKRLAFSPQVFAQLNQEYGERPPGETNLRHTLIKNGFLPKAAEDVVKAYLDNIKLVGGGASGYNGEVEEKPMKAATEDRTVDTPTKTVFHGPMRVEVPVSTRTYAFDISIPREVKGELKIVGQFGKDDLERLRKALTGQLAMIEAALED